MDIEKVKRMRRVVNLIKDPDAMETLTQNEIDGYAVDFTEAIQAEAEKVATSSNSVVAFIYCENNETTPSVISAAVSLCDSYGYQVSLEANEAPVSDPKSRIFKVEW